VKDAKDVSIVLEAILASLQSASEYNQNDQVAPAAILWTDKDEQWEPLLPILRQLLPQLLTLGAYDPASRTEPAIWLKCMLARALPEADWPADVVPILYLPAVGRQELRAVEECPKGLQPLAELQYRAVYWTQLNARDWTLLAFLQSKDGGLGLDVARDAATLEAMRRALLKLSETPITELQGKRLEAADFDAVLTPDPARDLLTWLNDPAGTRQRWEESAWAAFSNICRQPYNFDPHTDGELVGGELLGGQQGAWQSVWERCAEAPQRYARLPELLRRAGPKPADALFLTRKPDPAWPQDNEAMEAELCQYDVVCFDEISGVSFDQKDGVNIMKGYMESAEFSRSKESIRANGGIVMVGNFDVDVQHQRLVGHLFGLLPPEMRHDTAFMDRIHAYLPGWDVPKLSTAFLVVAARLVWRCCWPCAARFYKRASKRPGSRRGGKPRRVYRPDLQRREHCRIIHRERRHNPRYPGIGQEAAT
jgi:hypothetical protein